MPTLILKDHNLHYTYIQSAKQNQTILFLHDLCLDSGMWQSLLPHIEHHDNLLTYDLYGHGKTTDSSALLSLELLVDEVHDLLRHLNLDHVRVVGCKYGALLALELALQMPQCVKTLTLMSLPLFIKKFHYHREEVTNLQLLHLDWPLFVKKYMMKNMYQVTLQKARIIHRAFRRVPSRQIHAAIQELLDRNDAPSFDFIEKLKQVQQPALFLHGMYDPIFPGALAMMFSSYAGNSRFVVIPAASSLIPLDQPEDAANLINHFIASRKTAPFAASESRKFITRFNETFERNSKPQSLLHRKLRMTLLDGETHVYWNGQEIIGKWNWRHARELLLFLILNQKTADRDTLIDTFSEHITINQARNHLRVQLNHLNALFQNHTLQDVLIITRDSVTLNADSESDLGEFIDAMNDLIDSKEPVDQRSESLLTFLEDYHTNFLSTWNGAWIRTIEEKVAKQLAQTLAQILRSLKEEGNNSKIPRIQHEYRRIMKNHRMRQNDSFDP